MVRVSLATLFTWIAVVVFLTRTFATFVADSTNRVLLITAAPCRNNERSDHCGIATMAVAITLPVTVTVVSRQFHWHQLWQWLWYCDNDSHSGPLVVTLTIAVTVPVTVTVVLWQWQWPIGSDIDHGGHSTLNLKLNLFNVDTRMEVVAQSSEPWAHI